MISLRYGFRPLFVLTFLVGSSIIGFQFYQRHQKWIEIKAYADKYREDGYEHAYHPFYAHLFELAGSEFLSSLENLDNNPVAMQSAWQILEIAVPEEIEPNQSEQTIAGTTAGPFGTHKRYFFIPNSGELVQFLTNFQHRTSAMPPLWWQEIVLGSRGYDGGYLLPGDPRKPPYKTTRFADLYCPHAAAIQKQGDTVSYRVGKETITLSKNDVDAETHNQYTGVSGLFHKNHFLVATHNDWGFSHDLKCFERADGKLLWSTSVIGCCNGIVKGENPSWVELTPSSDGRIFVFGASGNGFYAQGFDLHSGASTFRFSTMYAD